MPRKKKPKLVGVQLAVADGVTVQGVRPHTILTFGIRRYRCGGGYRVVRKSNRSAE